MNYLIRLEVRLIFVHHQFVANDIKSKRNKSIQVSLTLTLCLTYAPVKDCC